MLRPSRALAAASKAEPLPRVDHFQALYDLGVVLRRGEITMIAGRPGAMKSTLAMDLVDSFGLPVLYFSADMNPRTATVRLAARRTGHDKDVVSEAIMGPGVAFYEEALEDSQVHFCFDSAPTIEDLRDEVTAYIELYDAFPEVIVVDNLMNFEADSGGDEHAGQKWLMQQFHKVCRWTGAAMFVLHHASENSSVDPNRPSPSREIQNKVTQLPEIVLTVALDRSDNSFRIAPVKNRDGVGDPSGKAFATLTAYPNTASFGPYVKYYFGVPE